MAYINTLKPANVKQKVNMKDLRKQILAQGFFILTFLNKRKFNRNEGGKSFWLLIFLSECQRKGLSCFGLPMFVNVSKNCFFIYNQFFLIQKVEKSFNLPIFRMLSQWLKN